MNYPRLLTEQMMLIKPAAYAQLRKASERGRVEQYWGEEEDDLACGMWVEDGVAHIPVFGPLGRALTQWDFEFGATDFDELSAAVRAADEDKDVKAILLDIDSPGGMVNGTPETADVIASVNKPIYAFSGGMICSAAYWLAAATDGIFATKSADIGSIGVLMPFIDMSGMLDKFGVKVHVFASGKYKGAGYPGTSLTDDQFALFQEQVMETADMFYRHVKATRGDVSDDDMQGQSFMAPTAEARGLIDKVVRDKEEVLATLR